MHKRLFSFLQKMAKSKGKRKRQETLVWYQLYGEGGKPFKKFDPSIVSVDESYVVAELKDAIYAKNKPILPEKFVASFLKVYQRQENQGSSSSSAPSETVDLSNQELLAVGTKVNVLVNGENKPLVVVVPVVYGIFF